MNTLLNIIKFAREHGYSARLDRTRTLVLIQIPYNDGTFEIEQVSNVQETYAALGY